MASGHGGARSGAGRPAGSKSKLTKQLKATLTDVAQEYTQEAIEALADVMRNGSTDSARVAAANSILDRGHGKPVQATVELPADSLPAPFTGFYIDRAEKPDTADAN